MFEDGKNGFLAGEFGQETQRGVDIDQVVVGELFSGELLEGGAEVAEKYGLLMRILPVAKAQVAAFAVFEYGFGVFAVEVLEDGGVVMRRNLECPAGEKFAILQAGLPILSLL